MKTNRIFTLIAAAFVAAALVIAGCSGDTEAERSKNVVDEMVDSVASSVAQSFEKARLARQGIPTEDPSAGSRELADPDFSPLDINDMIVVDTIVYAVADDRLIIYDLGSRTSESLPAGGALNAVTYHAGKVYVGGDELFELAESVLEPVEFELEGMVTDLYSHGYRLMIGTSNGLFAKSIFGNERLFDDIDVTDMAEDNAGLWVGTQGQGLYRWDGSEFKRRYLVSDTAIFDFVNALDFNHNHLYVGTDEALYVYDGGRWETVNEESGLKAGAIRSIDASDWVVYIATSKGLSSWFNYDILPVKKIGDIPAKIVRRSGKDIIVATETDGLLLKSGPVVTTLIEPSAGDDGVPVAVSMK